MENCVSSGLQKMPAKLPERDYFSCFISNMVRFAIPGIKDIVQISGMKFPDK